MKTTKVALIGNPNTGKSSVFNLLTGLNQQVGNFPGVTVDKKTGHFSLSEKASVSLVDLPGTYSVFPRSKDEEVVYKTLTDTNGPDFPEQVVVLVDVSNLERNLFLFTQLYDMGLPLIMGLTMTDLASERQLETNIEGLKQAFPNVPIVSINGRTGAGIGALKEAMLRYEKRPTAFSPVSERSIHDLYAHQELQAEDARERYAVIREVVKKAQRKKTTSLAASVTQRLDRIAVHPIYGYALFAGILLLIFQFIFSIAAYPMDWIDGVFLQLSQWVKDSLPAGLFTDLLAEGVVPGIGGVLVFIPQIALLFFFLSILEETGYMSRVVFIMDKLVRPFGLNGRSVVPLMSSVACAIPGIMATRTISSWKDRLITIMVAPLMSCSARIPVYTLLIALIVPDDRLWGVFQLQGVVLFGLYAMGLFSALLVAAIMKKMVNSREKSFLLMELPPFKFPRWKQVGINLWEKTRVFVVDAGKVILAISIVLWALASYGPSDRMARAEAAVEQPSAANGKTQDEYEKELSTARLENSYVGILGKGIEPVIRPLGYDWKIGIALITSFAAREVFVGSMAAIYSAGEDFEEDHSLLERMREEVNPQTGEKVYSLASGASLMVFYVFAMQCMATFAVVKRETKTWKWPVLQMLYMGILAYLGAFITFTLLQ
jgi:ferrous iron transport protein B